MRLLVALALLGTALAGCVTPPDVETPAAALETNATGLLAYDGTGAIVPVPDALAKDAPRIVERLLGHRGGEPNVGVTSTGTVFMTANHNTMRSKDHGQTWDIAFNLTTAFPAPVQGTPLSGYTRSSDPMLWVDPVTDRVFTNHMTSLLCANMIISDDEGDSWTMKPMTCGIPVNDHQKVATSIGFGPKAKVPDPVYPNAVYYCYNKLVGTNCAVSLDGGLNFAYDRPVATGLTDNCGGINGHPAPHPDGTMFVPMTLGCAGPVVGVSEDNGLTWTVRHGPTDFGAEEIDPDVTVTKEGTAYMLYRGSDHLQYLVRSKDKFQTWEGPWKVSPPDVRSTVFAGITSGDDDRIAMAYLGTRDTDEEPSKAGENTTWHLFVTYSFDALAESPTFVTTQVDGDDDPIQIGCVWLNGGGNPCRNMLDFIDMTSDADGRIFVAITDGCDKCATDKESHNRNAAIVVLEEGPSLYAAVGRVVEGSTAG